MLISDVKLNIKRASFYGIKFCNQKYVRLYLHFNTIFYGSVVVIMETLFMWELRFKICGHSIKNYKFFFQVPWLKVT